MSLTGPLVFSTVTSPPRSLARPGRLATAAALLAASSCGQSVGSGGQPAGPAPSAAVAPDVGSAAAVVPGDRLRYSAVRPIFEAHCASCHDKNRSDNSAAQRVFEASSYPFSTGRPDTLLEDLETMFQSRKSVPEDERSRAMRWIEAGALDDQGNAPPYSRPSE